MLVKLFVFFRNRTYWTMDILNGKKVFNNKKNIKLYNSLDFYDRKLQDYHNRKLNELVEHAKTHTKYYSKQKKLSSISNNQ
ncbi:hypothetical protein KHQ89_05720 [Mycoplasmatota bacterium]|nr:hypothetical protein KHQ89_05720 [Mycoplasmatota bacterium]